MFEFFFKYPMPVFTKGKLVLLGSWPGWVLLLLIVVSVAGLGWLIWRSLPEAAPKMRTWRAGVVWLLQSLLVTLVLVLLWQPAMTVAELKSQQNMIAVLVDDSRSMAIADSGRDGKTTREAAAVQALKDGNSVGVAEEVSDAGVPAGWQGLPGLGVVGRDAGDGFGNAHQRRAEAVGGGDSGPACGRGGAVERRQR